MSYSRNFGFRTFENLVRDGRNRAPSAGFVIGEPVTLDTDNPGRLKAATAGQAPSQVSGLAVFEHIQYKGVDTALQTYSDGPLTRVPGDQYAQMVHGVGAKVWLRNTPEKTLYDGRVRAADGLLALDQAALDALNPGDGLVPDGAGKYRVAADADGAGAGTALEPAWLVVEHINASAGLVEARLTF